LVYELAERQSPADDPQKPTMTKPPCHPFSKVDLRIN